MSDQQEDPLFVVCRCQHCDGHVEFDASGFKKGETRQVACPHCGLETLLFVAVGQTEQANRKPASITPKNVSVEVKRGASPLGIGSVVLGIMGCVICWIPFFGLFAIPVAMIGFILAFAGVVMAGMNRKTGFVFPISGGILCVLAMCIALVITGALTRLTSGNNKTNQTIVGNSRDSSNDEWSKSLIVRQGDVQIKVENWSELHELYVYDSSLPYGMSGKTYYTGSFFTVNVVVSNLSETKMIDFTTWRGDPSSAGRDYATLSDNNGNIYKRISFGSDTIRDEGLKCEDEGTIYPQKSFTDLLVFQRLVTDLKWLHLELPAKNFGGTGMIRFKIPVTGKPGENGGWR